MDEPLRTGLLILCAAALCVFLACFIDGMSRRPRSNPRFRVGERVTGAEGMSLAPNGGEPVPFMVVSGVKRRNGAWLYGVTTGGHRTQAWVFEAVLDTYVSDAEIESARRLLE